ncbi:hypothetical protein NDU88_001417 [Pleurodeles waltl]|uniref:Uncharacterized protein n=1 Tax=Pleurodeles waltl TaxID=8319 RepID=A0AAV7U999_PLEWA|nr:hypothetical protein NDU88_001417 [Pleurodeles waltl]
MFRPRVPPVGLAGDPLFAPQRALPTDVISQKREGGEKKDSGSMNLYVMASNCVRVGRRKGSDTELTQLLKLVLAKLGDGDSDSGDTASEVENNGVGLTRPRRTHEAPRAAFPQ